MSKKQLTEVFIGEFRGSYPDVPFSPNIDYEALIATDKAQETEPFFLTLPVAAVDRISRNGLIYTSELVQDMADQINSNTPEGIMGHLKDEDTSSAYPLPAIYWVGSMLDEAGTLWAKGFIPSFRPEVRDHYRSLKAMNAKVGTSLFGQAHLEAAEEGDYPEGSYFAREFELDTLDLVPHNRAALQMGSGAQITSQMFGTEEKPEKHETIEEDESPMEREEVIQTLALEEIPETLVEQIERGAREKLAAELSVKPEDLVKTISDLMEENQKMKEAQVTTEIQAVLEQVELVSYRPAIKAALVAHNPQTPEDVQAIFEQLMDDEDLKKGMAEAASKEAGEAPRKSNVNNQFKPNNDWVMFPKEDEVN